MDAQKKDSTVLRDMLDSTWSIDRLYVEANVLVLIGAFIHSSIFQLLTFFAVPKDSSLRDKKMIIFAVLFLEESNVNNGMSSMLPPIAYANHRPSGKQISIQNVSRHMKVIHPESITTTSGDMKPPPSRGYQPY